jgi:hypothetical protein
MTQISVTFENIFEQVPRFLGAMSLGVEIKTTISGLVVDEINNIYPEVSDVKPFNSIELSLSSNINLANSALQLSLSLSID